MSDMMLGIQMYAATSDLLKEQRPDMDKFARIAICSAVEAAFKEAIANVQVADGVQMVKPATNEWE